MTDLVAVKNMSLSDFNAQSVLLVGVTNDAFADLREWCEKTYPDLSQINLSGYEIQHGKWTVRASFVGDEAVKHAAMFRMFWG